ALHSHHAVLPSLPTRRSSDLAAVVTFGLAPALRASRVDLSAAMRAHARTVTGGPGRRGGPFASGKLLVAGQVALSLVLLVGASRSEEHTSELQSRVDIVCRLR